MRRRSGRQHRPPGERRLRSDLRLRGDSADCGYAARRTSRKAARPGYFLEPRRSCSKGPLLLILCPDARRSRGFGGAAVPFAHIAYCRERASPTATGGCEESAAAQAGDVHGLAALDDRAADEVDGFAAGDGDAGAAGHCASVAPRSEEHTSELQSQFHIVCRLLLENKKNKSHPCCRFLFIIIMYQYTKLIRRH